MDSISEIYDEVGQVVIETWKLILFNYRDPRHGKGALSRNSKLIKSMGYEIPFSDRQVEEGANVPVELIFNMEDYGEYLDRGRNPFTKKVPIQALIKFIRERGLQTKIRGRRGRFISANRIAFILQNSIYKFGISGRNFIQPGIEAGERVLIARVDSDLLDILLKPLLDFYSQN